jgi:hypothetical protein
MERRKVPTAGRSRGTFPRRQERTICSVRTTNAMSIRRAVTDLVKLYIVPAVITQVPAYQGDRLQLPTSEPDVSRRTKRSKSREVVTLSAVPPLAAHSLQQQIAFMANRSLAYEPYHSVDSVSSGKSVGISAISWRGMLKTPHVVPHIDLPSLLDTLAVAIISHPHVGVTAQHLQRIRGPVWHSQSRAVSSPSRTVRLRLECNPVHRLTRRRTSSPPLAPQRAVLRPHM